MATKCWFEGISSKIWIVKAGFTKLTKIIWMDTQSENPGLPVDDWKAQIGKLDLRKYNKRERYW